MRTIIIATMLLFAVPTYGGWLDSTLESVGQGLGGRAAHEAGNSAYEGAKEGIKGAVKPKDKSKQPRAEDAGNADSQEISKSRVKKTATDGDQQSSGGSLAENEKIFSKYDFIPGDKVIFFDDFSDTDIGEFPRKWHLKGPKSGSNNAVEIVDFQGERLMRSQPASGDQSQFESTQYIRLTQKGDMPVKFTIEFDAYFTTRANDDYNTFYNLYLLNNDSSWPGQSGSPVEGVYYFSGFGGHTKNSKTEFNKNDKKLHHIAVSVVDTFVKAYVDNVRVINDPDGAIRPIKMIGISMGNSGNMPSDKVMIGNVRLAEGGKDVKSALDTDGKIITHGILFDTGKDVIKAESLPTLKMILGILNDDPELMFSIEGHTDNQGNKGINQPLSEKRAAAVKKWLVGKDIEPARLKTKGFGDTKSLESNKTPEGRANNRRVEFVKF